MAFANLAAYMTARRGAFAVSFVKNPTATYQDTCAVAPDAISPVPTTAVIPTRTSQGMIQRGPSSGTRRIVGLTMNSNNAVSAIGGIEAMAIVGDRLSHQGGLLAATPGAQTTNLPTAALTRHTSGEGVFLCLTVTTAFAGSPVVEASYTNQAGVAGRTTESYAPGNVVSGAMVALPLQAGDTGVRSVESVTFTTPGSAGVCGVVLFRPLVSGRYRASGVGKPPSDLLVERGVAPVVDADAALSMRFQSNGVSAHLFTIYLADE